MPDSEKLNLLRDLGDGLILRWATPDDVEELAQFNMAMHSDDPEEPDSRLYHWTYDLMRGNHPTTQASDFTLVVDTRHDNRIVSSLNLISQTWAYEGIPFGVGRPELVATLPEYRRRGLVRLQMAMIHDLSASRGELVTAITGIPWYYRLFGYEMGLNLGGSRHYFWGRLIKDAPVETEPYRVRAATADDIPLLNNLYQAYLANSPIVRLRDEAQWHYEMFTAHPEAFSSNRPHVIETLDGRAVAYATWEPWASYFWIREIGVVPGHSWRAVGQFVSRFLRREAESLNPGRAADKQLTSVQFNLGEDHPLYEALDPELGKQSRPYAWYVRVPYIPAFLRHIAPALEKRLAGSVMAGYTGTIRVNLFRSRFTLEWDTGLLKQVGDGFETRDLEDGDALFPDLTFLQLLFGYRSIDELTLSFADFYTKNNDALVLLRILFPKRPSRTIPME
ncbi:MAG: GNAT family N-acetyltransferase [Candidatus Promineofilum sp.]|nr:GNAT family N-acetyltransferase [Promineifilum sp.]